MTCYPDLCDELGDLVVEPICQNPVSQQDAISACQDFQQNISILPVGTHVKVTGSYVLGWAEIHLKKEESKVKSKS